MSYDLLKLIPRSSVGGSHRFDLNIGESEFVISTKRWSFMMKEYQRLRCTRWDCKDLVVFIQKKRKKRIFGVLRQHLGEILRELAKHKQAQIAALNCSRLIGPFEG